jgi:TRAP-type C4-dicarboxylate transport system permease small subunit
MLHTFDHALIRVNRWAVIAILAAMALMVFTNVALRFQIGRASCRERVYSIV